MRLEIIGKEVNTEMAFTIASSSFVVTHDSLGPHSTLLMISIYAPPPNSHSMHDPQGITDAMLKCANRIVKSWTGPAIIQGDFNQDISANADIAQLLATGWVDAHGVSVQIRDHVKKPAHVSHPMGAHPISPKSCAIHSCQQKSVL